MTTDTTEDLKVSAEGATGIIELARPRKLNCLSLGMMRGILGALRGFEADPGMRVVLLRAQGPHFCAGADLPAVDAIRHDQAALRAMLRTGHDAFAALEHSRLPVICAVQGLALAGGLELALAADIVLAGRSARFGDVHARYGLIPGWGGTQRLPRIVGQRRALELLLGGGEIDAVTARDWGLVNIVVEDEALAASSMEWCAGVARRSAGASAAVKRLVRNGTPQDEIDTLVHTMGTADVTEGLTAFRERRAPVFSRNRQ